MPEHSSAVAPTSSAELVTLEIVRRKLAALVLELGASFRALARSQPICDARACSVSILDRSGRVVAIDNPSQLGVTETTAAAALKQHAFDVKDGDVIVSSDPYSGGSAVQDFSFLAPFLVEYETQAFVCVRGRVADIGGDARGSIVPGAREIWAEGVPVPPIRLVRLGRKERDIWVSLLLNTRLPDDVGGDVEAALAVMGLGERRLTDIVGAYGAAALAEAFGHAQDYVERQARAAIASCDVGSFGAAWTLAPPAPGTDPAEIDVTVHVSRDALHVDLTGSGREVLSFLNSSEGSTRNAVVTAVVAALDLSTVANSGLSRVLEISTASGSVVHPLAPRAVGGGPIHVAPAITDAVAECLQRAAGTVTGRLVGAANLLLRTAADGHPDDISLWGAAGCSATEGRDGWGPPHLSSYAVRPSVEEWEARGDATVERFEFVADTCGHGRWRGSPAVELAIRIAAPERWTVCMLGPAGRAGAAEGAPPAVWFESDAGGAPQPLDPVTLGRTLDAGRIIVRFAGGSGLGSPLARAREAVVGDVLDGIYDAQTAQQVYDCADVAEVSA